MGGCIMAFFKWQPVLNTGISKIDSQHRNLVRMINGLHIAMGEGKGKDVIVDLVDDLIRYSITHFNTEEELMEKYVFHDFEEHTTEHKAFTEKVFGFEKELADGNEVLSIDVMCFLKDWLFHHISVTDKKYEGFIK
jgi:hemerythrin